MKLTDFELYKQYMEELWTYCPEDKEIYNPKLAEWFYELTHSKRIRFHKVYNNDKCIGFLFVEELRPEDQEIFHAKYYIPEAYIVPQFRQKKLMSSMLEQFLQEFERDGVCLHVIKNNTTAIDFWMSYFKNREFGYYILPEYEGYEDCNFYWFYKPA